MKTILKAAFSLSLAVIILTGCKKDDDKSEDPSNNNNNNVAAQTMVYGAQTFNLGQGFGAFYGDSTDSFWGYNGYNIDIYLQTDGVTIMLDSNNVVDSAYGDGYRLYFEMFSSDSVHLAPGTYTYNQSLDVNTFDMAEMYDIVDGEDGNFYATMKSGTMQVTQNGNTTKLVGDFEMLDVDGTSLKFNFSGTIPLVDYSGKRKK